MKAVSPDKDRSAVEVTYISKHGLWLLTKDEELFVSFNEFPQFQSASVSQIMNVERPHPDYLHWPNLGLNLPLQSIRRFPLISKQVRRDSFHRRAKTKIARR
ncbi:MAG: DUF2442 domain-containing protein [Nitrospira sp.]